MAAQTAWQKTKTGSKRAFDKTWAALDKLGDPVNRLSNKVGSEAFWPMTLDRESEKAARILRSFCKEGFYSDEKVGSTDAPKGKQRVVKKIPAAVIKNAKGLAVFTTMRTGLWVSGAGGSGVVIARKPDGSWSEPSGILLHTAGLGWLVGVDIYDCVLVLNTQKAVDAFTKLRWTVGGEVSVVAGPAGVGGVFETELHKRQAPIFSYMKSRGFYAGVQVDGSVVIERFDENERFYGQKLSSQEILAGKVRHPPFELEMLMETLKAAQGDAFDETKVATGFAPADFQVEESGHVFGVPDKEDPDPFGLLALKAEGMTLHDAATHEPVEETHLEQEFAFQPSTKSPIFATYHHARASSAAMSTLNGEKRLSMDAATQTDGPLPSSPVKRGPPPPLPPRQTDTLPSSPPEEHDGRIVMEDAESDYRPLNGHDGPDGRDSLDEDDLREAVSKTKSHLERVDPADSEKVFDAPLELAEKRSIDINEEPAFTHDGAGADEPSHDVGTSTSRGIDDADEHESHKGLSDMAKHDENELDSNDASLSKEDATPAGEDASDFPEPSPVSQTTREVEEKRESIPGAFA